MKTNALRQSGFSMAEMMVAIAILGIGLLMVAASFPVGIDQTRIVKDETLSPKIASQAYNLLKSYEPAREALRRDLTRAVSDSHFGLIRPGYNKNETGITDYYIDDWYQDVFPEMFPVQSGTDYEDYEHPARVYQAKPWDRAEYTWSFVGQRLYGTNVFQTLVFVCRGQSRLPVLIRNCELKQPTDAQLEGQVPDVVVFDTTHADYVTDGGFIVEQSTGQVYKLGARVEDLATYGLSATSTDPVFYLRPSAYTEAENLFDVTNFSAYVVPLEQGRSPVIGIHPFYLYLTK